MNGIQTWMTAFHFAKYNAKSRKWFLRFVQIKRWVKIFYNYLINCIIINFKLALKFIFVENSIIIKSNICITQLYTCKFLYSVNIYCICITHTYTYTYILEKNNFLIRSKIQLIKLTARENPENLKIKSRVNSTILWQKKPTQLNLFSTR